MSIASEIQNYADGLSDAYDAVNDMSGVIPQDKNMNNLDTAIRTIPIGTTPNDGVLTIEQNGVTIQTFSANQSANATASLTDTTYSDFTGAASQQAGAHGLVPAPAAGDDGKFLQGDGTWAAPTGTTYTAGTNVQISAQNVISATDTTYSDFTGATSSVAGAHGLVPAPAAGDEGKALHGDGTWKDTTAKLVEMSYGESSAWAKFIAAYNAGSIVYCRASSNANPGTGSQTRKAFMAYVNNATSPTSVEFQYVRSNSSKSDSQQCDQVFVYTLTNASGGTWSVATRDMSPKILVDTTLNKTFSGGANASVTLGAKAMTGATSGAAGTAGIVPAPAAGDESKVLSGAGTWVAQSGGTTTTFYLGSLLSSTLVYVYSDSGLTTKVSYSDFWSAYEAGKVYLKYTDSILQSDFVYEVLGYTNPDGGTNGVEYTVAGYDGMYTLATEGAPIPGYPYAANKIYSAFIGATSSTAGNMGDVPAPAAGDQDKVLKGDGTWANIFAGNTSANYASGGEKSISIADIPTGATFVVLISGYVQTAAGVAFSLNSRYNSVDSGYSWDNNPSSGNVSRSMSNVGVFTKVSGVDSVTVKLGTQAYNELNFSVVIWRIS